MKYFTRQLYDASQPKHYRTQEEEEAAWPRIEALWNEAQADYQRLFATIVPSLPVGARAFFESVHMHDAAILSVSRSADDTVTMRFDTSGSYLPGKHFQVSFLGVKLVDGIDGLEGDWWLYDEVHPSHLGAFDLQVLFEHSEFRIVADDISYSAEE